MKLDPKQSHYVLKALLVQRKVGARHVNAVLRDWRREIAALRERLAALEGIGGGAAAKGGRRAAVKARPKRRLSPKVRALRRQQGQYMGLVRSLPAAQKARVRVVREKKGLPAAIRLARSLGRS